MATNKGSKILGLSAAEADIYTAALELGQSLPAELARRAGVKRPTLYKLLPALKARGLISETVEGRRKLLVAEDPQQYLENKQKELETFENMIPELRSLLRTATVRPKIISYEGVEGLRKLYMETLREKKPILEFVSLENISSDVEFHSRNYYIPQRINRNIPIKILVSGKTSSKLIKLKTDPYALREVKVIDGEKYPIPLDCYVFGDNVAFALYRKDSEPIGIIIRSVEVATMMRSLHSLLWMIAESE